MKTLATFLLVLLMLGTFGVLIAGLFGMVRGGDPRRSNTLMRWRVLLQAAALVMFAILVSILRS